MIRFASPLPNNYDQIVRIFTEERKEEEVKPLPSWVTDPSPERWDDDHPANIRHRAEQTQVLASIPEDSIPAPIKSVVYAPPPTPIPQALISTAIQDTTPITLASSATPIVKAVPTDPFLAKPAVLPVLNEEQLVAANPTLEGVYLQQRNELLEKREAASSAESLKEMEKVAEASKQMDVEIPQEFLEMQRKQFEQQQAALLAARASLKVEDESKLGRESQIGLPPPNAKPVKRAAIHRTNLVPEAKAHLEVEQAIPQAVIRPVESLRLDELRRLCVQHQVPIKGNKPDLVARLKQKNVYQITV